MRVEITLRLQHAEQQHFIDVVQAADLVEQRSQIVARRIEYGGLDRYLVLGVKKKFTAGLPLLAARS